MNEDTTFDPWDIRIAVLSRGIVGAQLAIDAVMPLGDVALRVRQSEKLAGVTKTLRRMVARGGRGPSYQRSKLLLPAAIPAAQAPAGTPLKELPVEHHNGLYGFDLDEDRDNLERGGNPDGARAASRRRAGGDQRGRRRALRVRGGARG